MFFQYRNYKNLIFERNKQMKSEKGSATAIVIYTILAILIILTSLIITFSYKSRTQIIEMDKLRNVYDVNMSDAYNDYQMEHTK